MSAAEVYLRPDRGGLEIVPDQCSAVELAKQLRARHPGLRLRQSHGRLQVSFRDAEALLGEPESFGWSPVAQQAVENRRRARRDAPAVLGAAARLRAAAAPELREALPKTGVVEVLDEHQLRNVALMTIPDSWGSCIFDEQGTGKTPTVIAAFDVLVERNEADVLLVVSPKSMVAEWAEEFRRFTGDLYRVVVLEGSRAQRSHTLASGADVVVVNYEGAVSLLEDLRLLALRSRIVLAVDESFAVKNPDAARSAALVELREWCVRCFALCGTPAPNSPQDVVAQVDLVDFGMTFEGLGTTVDVETQRALIGETLRTRGLFSRNLKRDVLPDLPSRRFTEVRVEFEREQGELYSQALDGLIIELEHVDDIEYERRRMAFAERRSALLRLCSHPAAVVASYAQTPAKIVALDALLADRVTHGEKVVLWSFYRYTLQALARRYAGYGVARVDGSVADTAARRDAIQRFQEDEETMVFLGNPAAAGTGLTLHRAAVAVYESFSNQAAHFMQSLDRIHRRGQERDVEYVVLLCDGSLEHVEYERILRKVDVQAELLGDPEPYRPTREAMLSELTSSRDRLVCEDE